MESYMVKSGYVIREIADEYLAVPVGSGADIVVLNPVSKMLWECMQTPKTVDELVKAVVDEYGIGEAQAKEDIIAFIESLKKGNLIAE